MFKMILLGCLNRFQLITPAIHLLLFGVALSVHAQSLEINSLLPLGESSVSRSPKTISEVDVKDEIEQWRFHGQSTYLVQQKNPFHSAYNGQNSLLSKAEGAGDASYTLSVTGFLGARLWSGAEVYYNPEMFQGLPFGGELTGLGGFQNGELQKGAFTSPIYYTARAFLRQTFGLGGSKVLLESEANQLAGDIDKNRIVLSYGKFATLDFFDQNTYSHDPRTQFQNFALFSMGAYGYSADTRGFTYGGVLEWYQDDWMVKAARLALPTLPNTDDLDYSLAQDYTNQIEVTHEHLFRGQPGAIRVLLYQQHALMASYHDALNLAQQTNTNPNIFNVRLKGQESWGYGINLEQAITQNMGVFARWSWNPGATETQTLDISSSFSAGLSFKGSSWSRPSDTAGIGTAVNRIASSEISYLQQGGYTMFIGDHALNYQPEQIVESYYSAKVYKDFFITADYQYIANPAYNAARGPVNVMGIRAHLAM